MSAVLAKQLSKGINSQTCLSLMGTGQQSLYGHLAWIRHVLSLVNQRIRLTLWCYLQARSLYHQPNRLLRPVRKRQLVAPRLPTVPAAPSPMLSEAKSLSIAGPLLYVRPLCHQSNRLLRQCSNPRLPGTPLSARRLHQQRVTDTLPSFDLLDAPVQLNVGKAPRNWRSRHGFSNKSCENLALKEKWCRCYQALSSPCMSLPLLLG